MYLDYLLPCKLHKSIGIWSVQSCYCIFLYSSSFCTSLLDSYRHIRRLKRKSPIYYSITFAFGTNYFYSHKVVLYQIQNTCIDQKATCIHNQEKKDSLDVTPFHDYLYLMTAKNKLLVLIVYLTLSHYMMNMWHYNMISNEVI